MKNLLRTLAITSILAFSSLGASAQQPANSAIASTAVAQAPAVETVCPKCTHVNALYAKEDACQHYYQCNQCKGIVKLEVGLGCGHIQHNSEIAHSLQIDANKLNNNSQNTLATSKP